MKLSNQLNKYSIRLGINRNGKEVYAYSYNNDNNRWELSAVPLSYDFDRAIKLIEKIEKQIDDRMKKSPYKYPKNIHIELIET